MSRGHLIFLALLFIVVGPAVAGAIVHKVRTWGTLPRNRVRHLRFRLHLRRRPGRGFATGFQLWLRWGRLAAWRESGRVRPSLGAWYRLLNPAGAFGVPGPGASPAGAAGQRPGAPAGHRAAAGV